MVSWMNLQRATSLLYALITFDMGETSQYTHLQFAQVNKMSLYYISSGEWWFKLKIQTSQQAFFCLVISYLADKELYGERESAKVYE